jgi:hypothetical protein
MSPTGAMMWDVGSYNFFFGPMHPACPGAWMGCHKVGGNFMFRDGSVLWRKYSWMGNS